MGVRQVKLWLIVGYGMCGVVCDLATEFIGIVGRSHILYELRRRKWEMKMIQTQLG